MSELIKKVRDDLLTAQKEASGETALFALRRLEMNVSVTVSKDEHGGIDLKVVQLGKAGTDTLTHTVKIEFDVMPWLIQDGAEAVSCEQPRPQTGTCFVNRPTVIPGGFYYPLDVGPIDERMLNFLQRFGYVQAAKPEETDD